MFCEDAEGSGQFHEATHLTASDWDELQHTVLYQHPAVAEAGVIGIPDETGGEVVVAYVAKKEGVSATEAESIEFAKKQIAVHKVPEKVFFLPSLPKSAVGKVQRRALKEHYRSAHA